MLAESASLIYSQNSGSSLLLKVLNKRLLLLVLKTVQKLPEVEFLHFTVSIVNHAIAIKELRAVVIEEPLKTPDQIQPSDEVEIGKKYNYSCMLKALFEKLPEVVSIRKLH